MKVIVLLKQYSGKEYCFQNVDMAGGPTGSVQKIGHDEGNALEMALRMKEKEAQGEVEIIALAAGNCEEDAILREALALGADKAILVHDTSLLHADSILTAQCLAAAIHKIGDFDMVLAGYKSQDKREGSVGPMVAEFLRIPQISHVYEMIVKDRRMEAIADQGNDSLKLGADLPCCLVVNRMKNTLRIMTLQGVRKALKKEVIHWSFEDLEIKNDGCIPKTVELYQFRNKDRKKGEILNFKAEKQITDRELHKFLQKLRSDYIKRANN